MGIGSERVEWIGWKEFFDNMDITDEAVVPGLAYRGRWTAIAAPAKAGKSTFLLGVAVATAKAGSTVYYFDAEMGRADVLERLRDWMDLTPDDLVNLHYTDLPPKLDTIAGAASLGATIEERVPDLVVIDGLNGVVNGAENDDTTWRDFYEWSVAPMKALGVAVVSADNLGKDRTLGPRGSSVKLDKADAVLEMERTDQGCTLKATHRRTAAYPPLQHYVIAHADEDEPPMKVVRVEASDPEGTSETVAVLERLGLPLDMPIRQVRAALRASGHKARNATIGAAVRARAQIVPQLLGPFDETPGNCVPGPMGTIGDHSQNGDGPRLGDREDGTAGRSILFSGVSIKTPPPKEGVLGTASGTTPEADAEAIRSALKEQF